MRKQTDWKTGRNTSKHETKHTDFRMIITLCSICSVSRLLWTSIDVVPLLATSR